MLTMDRIRGRLVDIELEKVEPFGWVAVGVVMEGPSHEKGMLFEVKASDPIEAETKLRAEIEAFFA
ncbi:MAG: hypothetical protein A3J45_16180 [Candidatus Rokubacteria bacterium RIFCSPHIGHO2_02_FULL_69_13]|nr:MAG: hypothetical protein A3J45_16180 [Candidatus Rokubacteria bacterium RIFCSPHIGHO2_02_FULL_69_13]